MCVSVQRMRTLLSAIPGVPRGTRCHCHLLLAYQEPLLLLDCLPSTQPPAYPKGPALAGPARSLVEGGSEVLGEEEEGSVGGPD